VCTWRVGTNHCDDIVKVQSRRASTHEASVVEVMSDPKCHTVKLLSRYDHRTGDKETALMLEYVPRGWNHRLKTQEEAVKRAAQLTRVQYMYARGVWVCKCHVTTHMTLLNVPLHEVSRMIAPEQGVFEWHQRGYLHLDIKPDNVRVNGDGDVVIIDANIAKPISECAVGKVMRKGKAAGTPGFMDPLVADRVYDWSPAAEVWSLGFMLNDVCHES